MPAALIYARRALVLGKLRKDSSQSNVTRSRSLFCASRLDPECKFIAELVGAGRPSCLLLPSPCVLMSLLGLRLSRRGERFASWEDEVHANEQVANTDETRVSQANDETRSDLYLKKG